MKKIIPKQLPNPFADLKTIPPLNFQRDILTKDVLDDDGEDTQVWRIGTDLKWAIVDPRYNVVIALFSCFDVALKFLDDNFVEDDPEESRLLIQEVVR